MRNKFDFYSDAGHGWLKVSRAELLVLGIATTISNCSYAFGEWAFLEEDGDFSQFVTAWEAKTGLTWSMTENVREHTSDLSSIRGYAGYTPLSEVELTEMRSLAGRMRTIFSRQARIISSASLTQLREWARAHLTPPVTA